MDYSKILETYSLEEILEYNDIPLEDALIAIEYQHVLKYPPLPVDHE